MRYIVSSVTYRRVLAGMSFDTSERLVAQARWARRPSTRPDTQTPSAKLGERSSTTNMIPSAPPPVKYSRSRMALMSPYVGASAFRRVGVAEVRSRSRRVAQLGFQAGSAWTNGRSRRGVARGAGAGLRRHPNSQRRVPKRSSRRQNDAPSQRNYRRPTQPNADDGPLAADV